MALEPSSDHVTVTIDGINTSVPKGTLVIEAARQVGVMIPHFCYHPKLTPDANCRMCLVEIEKVPRLQTSCSTQVTDGMVVKSSVPTVDKARKSVLEFILANHPLDCPVCDQGGRCDLQDFSHQYTPSTSRFQDLKRVFPKEYFSPLIETQMNRCVQCLRCVRYCDQVMDVQALAPSGRGTMTEIKHFGAHELDCEFCGGCIQICPVGAITSRLSMYDFRPWMLKRADTICTYCGDGCQITIQTKNDELIEVNSTQGAGRNNGDLCARGYFGYHATEHPDRLQYPLIRQGDGTLAEATWEEALEFVAQRLSEIKVSHGPQAIGGLITSRCTNEELYLFQKFMRMVIGSNHIDSSARYGQVNAVKPLRRVQGASRWTVTFEDIVAADVLLLIGTNITETNPITGLQVKQAVKKGGATLLTFESLLPSKGTISNISTLASQHFSLVPGHFGQAVIGLVKAVLENELVDQNLLTTSLSFVQSIKDAVARITWDEIQTSCGHSQDAFLRAAHTLSRAERGVVLVGQGVLRAPKGSAVLTNVLDLLLLTGHLGRPGSGIGPLAEENNDQGAVEMGAMAEYLPGPVAYQDEVGQQHVAKMWEGTLPEYQDSSVCSMLQQAKNGHMKAMYIVGENPVSSLPPQAQAKESLEALEFLVCQELFLTETAKLADVVLPACSYAEKSGTFTNSEGMVQSVRKAINPVGDSRADWEILSAVSYLLDAPLECEDAKDIFKEIRSVISGYGLQGPVAMPSKVNKETVLAYTQSGFQTDVGTRYDWRSFHTESSDMLTLQLTQSLFHSGKFSTKAKGLMQIQDSGALSVNPQDAQQLGIQQGDQVTVSNSLGQVQVKARLLDRVPMGVAFFPEHFDEEIRSLFSIEIDPSTGVPYGKLTQVRVAPVSAL
jgi:formate dehydrogenase alpha subunit